MILWSLREIAALAAATALALGTGPLLGALFLADLSDRGIRRAAPLGAFLVHAAVLAWVILVESPKLRAWFRPRWRDAGLGLLSGAALTAIGVAYAMALAALGVDVPDVAAELRGEAPLGALLVWGVVLVPLAEEAFFRGRLPDAISERLGRRVAVGVSSGLFALAHGLPPLLPVYVVFGYLLWALRERTGALVAPVIAHALVNAFALVPWGR